MLELGPPPAKKPEAGGLPGYQGGDMLCPKCEGKDCIHIEIQLSGEDRVQFYSCRQCESKWWERDGDTVALDEVLNLAAESKVR